MALRTLNCICLSALHKGKISSRLKNSAACNIQKRNYSRYDPDYLELLKPEIPEYPLTNVQIKGYDFPPLENFSKYIVKTAKHMRLDVVKCWPTPGTVYNIKSYVPGTIVTEHEYKLTLYERNVQIANVPSTIMPIFLQLIQNCLPEGIQLSVHPHEEEYETYRYIPDLELEELSRELDILKPAQTKK